MMPRAAVVVLALALNPALLRAQDTVFTVSVQSADVYKGPSNATPVIGHVPRGTVLTVSRNLGSWVRVPWPASPDGAGYLHVTTGRVGPASGAAPAATMPPRASAAPAGPAPLKSTSAREQVAPRPRATVTSISHVFGVGGVAGSMSTFGASARKWRNWSNNRVGLQVGFTRDAMNSDVAPGRVTAVEFEPGVVYALFDRVTDYVWIRPYVGSVVSVRRQTFRAPDLGAEPVSDSGLGFRVFGGSELTFASVPRFSLSADVGYRRFPTPFPGFEADPFGVSIAGHWYVR
jgi:hypothetical protein